MVPYTLLGIIYYKALTASTLKRKITAMDILDIWKLLQKEEQEHAAKCFFECTEENIIPEPQKNEVISAIAKARSFRPIYFKKHPEEKISILISLAKHPEIREHVSLVIRAWLAKEQRNLMTSFLDVSGIKHDGDALISDQESPHSSQGLAKGINHVLEEYPEHHVRVYLHWTVLTSGSGVFKNLSDAIKSSDLPKPEETQDSKPSQDKRQGALHEALRGNREIAEENEEFTTLDNLITTTLVAASFGTEGALDEKEARDLIEEIIDLNEKRQKTLFHLGFFDSLFEKEFERKIPAANDTRRVWYMTGFFFGLLRRRETDKLIEIITKNSSPFNLIISSEHLICGSMLLPHLHQPLTRHENFDELKQLVHFHIEKVADTKGIAQAHNILFEIEGHGTMRLQKSDTSSAAQCFDIVIEGLEKLDSKIPKEIRDTIYKSIKRKKAQILQVEGNFDGASKMLEQVLESKDFGESPYIYSDLGLIKGKFKSLFSLLNQLKKEDQLSSTMEALKKGTDDFQSAIRKNDHKATDAHVCMSLINLFSDKENNECEVIQASEHLRKALTKAKERKRQYEDPRLGTWIEFLLGMALLETLEESDFTYAGSLISRSLGAETQIPNYLWIRTLKAAAIYPDESIAELIGKHLLEKRGTSAFNELKKSGLLNNNKLLRASYVTFLLESEPDRPIPQQWDALAEQLPAIISDHQYSVGRGILDQLECIAIEYREYRTHMLELLSDLKNYSPLWNQDDADWSRIKIYELEGQYSEPLTILDSQFHKLIQRSLMDQARAVVERMRDYNQGIELTQYESNLSDAPDEPNEARSDERLKSGEHVKIIYIGGNENQERYENEIRSELKEEWEGLELEFFFPGWGSNWNKILEIIKPKIESSHGVVLNQLVRTNFGRHVRKICGSGGDKHPWTPCTGKGRQSLRNSIKLAAMRAIERRTEEWHANQVK